MTVLKTLHYTKGDHNKEFDVEIVSLPCTEVYLVDGPKFPLETITRMAKGYGGNYEIEDVSLPEVQRAIKDLNSTALKTPMEMATVVFLIKGVPRSWTHQAVRTRIGASYVQESMRFLGHKDVYRVLVSRSLYENPIHHLYCNSLGYAFFMYEEALGYGVSSEDARAILPTDTLTNIYIAYTLSAFAHVYEQRMCCQAQPGVWQEVCKKMKDLLVKEYGDDMGKLISAPYERGESCGYRASFDRPCVWQKGKE